MKRFIQNTENSKEKTLKTSMSTIILNPGQYGKYTQKQDQKADCFKNSDQDSRFKNRKHVFNGTNSYHRSKDGCNYMV